MLRPPSLSVLAALIAGLAASASGRVIVVDPAGGGDFTAVAPAVGAARAGDVVRVRPGVYRESVPLAHSGTADAPIVIEAEVPGTVVVTGADVVGGFERVEGGGGGPGAPGVPVWRARWDRRFEIDRKGGVPVEHHPADAERWGRAEQVFLAAPVDGDLDPDDEADGVLPGADLPLGGPAVGYRRLVPVGGLDALRALWGERDGLGLLPPVKGLAEPFAGAYYADTRDGWLYLWLADGSDPNAPAGGGRVEASARDLLVGQNRYLGDGVRHVEVRGIAFRHAANFAQRPAVWLSGGGNLLEDCVVEANAGQGVAVDGTLRRCLVRGNGSTGGSAGAAAGSGGTAGFANADSRWVGNSWKPLSRFWEAGGAKVAVARDGAFERCHFDRNGGPGLWLDIDVADVTITDCAFTGNENSGLFIEISRDITAERNAATGNGVGAVGDAGEHWSNAGIEVAESIDCVVRGNRVAGNRAGISFKEQGPRPIGRHDGPGMIDYHSRGTAVIDNVIGPPAAGGPHLGFWWDNAHFGPHPSPEANKPTDVPYDPLRQGLTVDGNTYVVEGGNRAVFQWGVPWRPGSRAFDSLGAFRATTGFEATGRTVAVEDAPPVPEVPATGPAWMR